MVVSFERMNRIVEIDTDNGVAVVEPGVRLAELDDALAPHGLVYPVRPGEDSASLGGTINTNAAGMRAVRYGVTRNHVLGLEMVLPTGEVVRSGGKVVKISSGYDLTQVVIGSEGTLALVTRIWLKLSRRPANTQTILAPFATLDQITAAIPTILGAGLDPLILEYIDLLTMAAILNRSGMDLGIPEEIRTTALAYLVVQLSDDLPERAEQDAVRLGELLHGELGAMDVFVLPGEAATQLIPAREHAFYAAKDRGSTTSSMSWCRARRCPTTSAGSARSPRSSPPGSSAAGTPATATCTWPCCRTTRRSASRSWTPCWPPASSSAGRSAASTASAGRRSTSSSSSPTPSTSA